MEEILSSIRRIIADEENEEARSDDEGAASPEADADALDTLEVLDDDDDEDDDDGGDVLELTSVVEEGRSNKGPVIVDEPEPVPEEPEDEPLASSALELVDDTADDDDDIEIADLDDLPDLPEVADLADDDIAETLEPVPEIAEVSPLIDDDDDDDAIDFEETTVTQEDELAVSTKKAETETLLSTGTASTTTGAFAKLSKAFRPTPVEESVADGAGRTVEQFIEDMARPMLKEWLDENMPAIVERLVQKEIQKIARRAELL